MTYRSSLTPTVKDIEKFKKICEDQGIEYDTEAEYRDAAQNLLNFYGLLYDMAKEDLMRKKRLEKELEGFEMEGKGRTCSLCKSSGYGLTFWYDKWGMKCTSCQAALNKKIIPGYVFTDTKNEKHVTDTFLSWKFRIHSRTIRKLVKQGKLKAIEIPGTRRLVFLRKDNPNLIAVLDEEVAQQKS